jgi:Kef-type K+ transport system membrane component KefB
LPLLIQLFVILAVSRGAGWLFAKIGQPRVMGEIAAGIALGPTVLGALAPEVSFALFPTQSLSALSALSQIGLILFLFLVGMRLDFSHLRDDGRAAIATSLASVLAPFALGAGLGVLIYPLVPHVGEEMPGFALFLGAAMSVTAFPVLARILREREMEATRVGTVALASAAVDDALAWLILAGVIAISRGGDSHFSSAAALGRVMAYAATMWFVARPALSRWKVEGLTPMLLLAFASGAVTDALGVHALFGAFVAGVVMPKRAGLAEAAAARIEPLTVNLLLPLFFTLTGLSTQLRLVSGGQMWAICGAIVVVAVLGKWGGTMIAARSMGMSWREASTLGILMNTRGLVELVVLKIGLDRGMLSPAVFSMMVVMTLATTFMTSPLLSSMNTDQHRN